jgi:cysteinyl-tRNA synthetase
MELKLYNTLTRSKEVFQPLDWRRGSAVPEAGRRVRMYVCGPTVYDFAHIGNARPVIVFDVLFRLLRHLYGPERVTYVRNITDVDDKINARSAEEYPGLPLNEAIRKVTETTDRQFHEDVAALGCLPPTVEPRATEHIAEMKVLIERLVASGHAYVAEEHVLFSVPSMPEYGKLSRRPLDEMIAGARVDVAPYKRDPMDFVLWKPSKPGEPAWPSPAGVAAPGRPGWHIECSAMAWKHLGETFDIHGGGIDLVFPHHENEIAQSRCAFATSSMAQIWMHNGFLQMEGEKMAKSLGNFVTIRELLQTEVFGGRSWSGEVLRLAMLRTHYRQPIDWTIHALEETFKIWVSFGNIVREHMNPSTPDGLFVNALADDLNTPAAMSRLFELRDAAARGDQTSGRALTASLRLLGFFEHAFELKTTISYTPDREGLSPKNLLNAVLRLSGDTELRDIAAHFQRKHPFDAVETVDFFRRFAPGTTVRDLKLIKSLSVDRLLRLDAERSVARASKNFAEADRIRDELAAMGVVLKDSKDGTTWEVAR